MHFAGRTWRPPYEANSVIIQATSGCTYGKCRFCSLYKDECFRMSPMEEFEEDLAEIKSCQPYARRIFWTGANPFAMSYENLRLRALTLFSDTELYRMEQEGKFTPAGEKERLEELQVFIKNLQIRTHLFANSSSNFYPVIAYLPRERDFVVGELQHIMDTVSEEEMAEYRRNLKSLG